MAEITPAQPVSEMLDVALPRVVVEYFAKWDSSPRYKDPINEIIIGCAATLREKSRAAALDELEAEQ